MFWLLGILVWLAFGVSLLGLLYVVAKYDMHATFVENGGFKFVVKGKTLDKILDNLDGKRVVDQKTHRVLSETMYEIDSTTLEISKKKTKEPIEKREVRPFEKWFGIVWVSIFWPIKKIHQFEIVVDKMRDKDEIKEKDLPVRQQLVTGTRPTTYLRERFPHPILISDVELGKDKWKLDLIMMLNIRVTNPAIFVFGLKGKVLEQSDALVRAVILDFCNDVEMDYDKFLNENKAGQKSAFIGNILRNNPTLEGMFGIEIELASLEAMDLAPSEKAQDEAAKEVARQEKLAQAKIKEGEGKKTFEKSIREGIGEGFAAQVRSLIGAGVNPVDAARIVQEQVRTDNLTRESSKITTYVEGGSNAMVTIPTRKE